MKSLDIDQLLNNNDLVLCGGSGGVGKTTTAAALGMRGAALGRRTLVLTIDPARRLAQAMGLETLSSEPQLVPGHPGLSAMMLDAGDTLDTLVSRFAETPERASAFMQSPYYKQISQTVAGSREFMAMQKLSDIVAAAAYELVIVDTPPSQHALDFIDAPKRLLEILDGTGLGILLRANHLANRMSFGLLGRGQKQFAKLFEQLTGHRLMVDLNDFYAGFGNLITTFKRRSEAIQNTLKGERSTFLMIATPNLKTDVVTRYQERLKTEEMNLAGILLNQYVAPFPACDTKHLAATEGAQGVGNTTFTQACEAYEYWQTVAHHHQQLRKALTAESGLAISCAPRLTHNVSSTEDLSLIINALTNTPGDNASMF